MAGLTSLIAVLSNTL